MRYFYLSIAILFLCHNLVAQSSKDPQHPKPVNMAAQLNKNIVHLQWSAPAVAQQTLFFESFESGNIPATWKLYDLDGDNEKWEIHPFTAAHTGTYSVASYSWFNGSVLTPNNWLITPKITLPTNAMLEFYVAAVSQNYSQEHYQIKISTTDSAVASFTQTILDETLPANNNAWQLRSISLAAFAGQQVYIAFVHNQSTNLFAIKIDDIAVNQYNKSNPELLGYHVYRTNMDNGTTIKLTSTIITDTFYNDYPALDGKYKYFTFAVYNDSVWSDTSAPATLWYFDYYPAPINLNAQITDNIVTLQWQEPQNTTKQIINEGFESNTALNNWYNFDYDGDGEKWELHPYTTAHTGSQSLASYSWLNGNPLTPNNWLISNKLPLKGNCNLSYWVAPISATYTAEHYSVYLSVSGLDTNSFVNNIITETLPTGTTQWQQRQFNISAYAGNNIHLAYVHHNITNQFALKIDDILLQATYLNTGYNVYRKHADSVNYQKINLLPINTVNFTDTVPQIANYKYVVKAIYPDNEESNASNIANVNVLIKEHELQTTAIHVYPNPAKEFATLTIEGVLSSKNISFYLYNVTGTIVLSGKLSGSNLHKPIILPLQGITAGVHLLEVRIGMHSFFKRLIIL